MPALAKLSAAALVGSDSWPFTAGLIPCSSLNRHIPFMESTAGLPGLNFSSGTGKFPVTGTGVAKIWHAIEVAKTIAMDKP